MRTMRNFSLLAGVALAMSAEGGHESDRVSVGDTAVDQDPATQVLEYGDYKIAAAQLPAKAIAYLLQNGFSQSMTDAAALTKAQKAHEDGSPLSEQELSDKVKSLRDARFDRILKGEVGVRKGGGPRATGIDAVIHAVATERLRAVLATKKLTLPQGKDKDGNAKTLRVGNESLTRDELIARYIAKNEADVRAEAERRVAANKDEAGLAEDLADVI